MKIHPMLVHFPIAFYFLELFLIVLWIKKKDEGYRRFSLLTFKLGYGFMLVAMAAGVVDAGGPANIRGMLQRHFVAALVVFFIYSLRGIFYWKTSKSKNDHCAIKLTGALIGYTAVLWAGYLGGLLVYD